MDGSGNRHRLLLALVGVLVLAVLAGEGGFVLDPAATPLHGLCAACAG